MIIELHYYSSVNYLILLTLIAQFDEEKENSEIDDWNCMSNSLIESYNEFYNLTKGEYEWVWIDSHAAQVAATIIPPG